MRTSYIVAVLVALVNRPQPMPAAEAERKDQVPDLRLGFQSSPVSRSRAHKAPRLPVVAGRECGSTGGTLRAPMTVKTPQTAL